MNQKHWKASYMTPSRIDSYVYHRDNDYVTTNDFIRQLLKLEPQSRNMLAGIALHSAIENIVDGNLPNKFISNSWEINVNIDIDLILPEHAEIKIYKKWQDILICGQVDRFGNGEIIDHKTTSKINLEKYFDSWAWRMYLWMMEYNHFRYNIFEISIDKNVDKLQINDYMTLNLERYPNLDRDVNAILTEYSQYLDDIRPLIERTKKENEKA